MCRAVFQFQSFKNYFFVHYFLLSCSLLWDICDNFISPNLENDKIKNILSLASDLRLEIAHPTSWIFDMVDNWWFYFRLMFFHPLKSHFWAGWVDFISKLNYSKLSFQSQRAKKFTKKIVFVFFHIYFKILHNTSIRMCQRNFRNVHHVDCKIFVLKMKKTGF